jgi:hypothetical protein
LPFWQHYAYRNTPIFIDAVGGGNIVAGQDWGGPQLTWVKILALARRHGGYAPAGRSLYALANQGAEVRCPGRAPGDTQAVPPDTGVKNTKKHGSGTKSVQNFFQPLFFRQQIKAASGLDSIPRYWV